jgi:hypothetical protein
VHRDPAPGRASRRDLEVLEGERAAHATYAFFDGLAPCRRSTCRRSQRIGGHEHDRITRSPAARSTRSSAT